MTLTTEDRDRIKAVTKQAQEAYQAIEKLAEELGVPIGNDGEYGWGAEYIPTTVKPEYWYSSDETGRWISSSEKCD